MSFEAFRRSIKADVFDYQVLTGYFGELKKVRDKITSLLAEGKIVRVKKGLYVFGQQWRNQPLCLEVLANLIYGPSCISFEYALSRYGLIAERARVITSLAIGDSKAFHTPVGVFEYRAIDKEKFKIGIEYRNLGDEGGYFIASREKAIADLVYRTPGIRSIQQMQHYLFEEMRLDEAMFRTLDFHLLHEIAKAYKKRSISLLRELQNCPPP